VHRALQNAALGADGDATIRTTVVDIVRKIDWPKPFTARVMKTNFVSDWHGQEVELGNPQLLEREMNRYVSAMQNGDPANTGVWVGEATGLIHDVRPAADLLLGMVGEAEGLLGATARSFIGVP
jgi:nitronate monooxygenase